MALSTLLRVSMTRSSFLIKPPTGVLALHARYLGSAEPGPRKNIYKTEEARKIRFYVLHKYMEYLKNYDKVLDRSFPGAMQVYRVFTVGIKEFVRDLRHFVRIVRMLNTKGSGKFLNLNRREIELYDQMPKDMRKVAPVLLISALPFANYVIFPLAYMFPRHLLSSHFWTLQQRVEFSVECLRDRIKYNRATFRCLQAQLDNLSEHRLYQPWTELLGMLGSGVQPSVSQILQCKELFMGEPYHLFYLKRRHVKFLLKIHGLHTGWFKRTRLADRARILQEMDKAILREGGVHNLPVDALKNCCLIRGLNPTNMKNDDMIEWLTKWVTISSEVDKENLSLLLHCPILLGYNEPSNWVLIYFNKR